MAKFSISRSCGFTTFNHPDYKEFSVHDSELAHLAVAVSVAMGRFMYSDDFDSNYLCAHEESANKRADEGRTAVDFDEPYSCW